MFFLRVLQDENNYEKLCINTCVLLKNMYAKTRGKNRLKWSVEENTKERMTFLKSFYTDDVISTETIEDCK